MMLFKSMLGYFIVPFLLIAIIIAAIGLYYIGDTPEKNTKAVYSGTVKVQSQPSKKINLDYLHCIATNIYHEARGEPYIGQVAVARVVMNRVQHGFAPNPCRVVYQKTEVPDKENPLETKVVCQFSWVCEKDITTNKSTAAYQQAVKIAHDILSKNAYHDVIPSSILYFHSTEVNPGWKYKESMTIGNHVFYSRGKN